MKLSVGYWRDPKWHGLGPMHEALWIRLLAYTVEHHTDGFIPANAISLCGRGFRGRERLISDLVEAGLLVRPEAPSASLVHPLCFSSAWLVFQQRSTSAPISPGQGTSLVRAGLEKRREEKISSVEDRNTTGPVLMNLDGMMHELRNGQWEQVNGSAHQD
jgi:hypothetical protein